MPGPSVTLGLLLVYSFQWSGLSRCGRNGRLVIVHFREKAPLLLVNGVGMVVNLNPQTTTKTK